MLVVSGDQRYEPSREKKSFGLRLRMGKSAGARKGVLIFVWHQEPKSVPSIMDDP